MSDDDRLFQILYIQKTDNISCKISPGITHIRFVRFAESTQVRRKCMILLIKVIEHGPE